MLSKINKYFETLFISKTFAVHEPLGAKFKDAEWYQEFDLYIRDWLLKAPSEEIEIAMKLILEIELTNPLIIGSLVWENLDFKNKHLLIHEKKFPLSEEIVSLLEKHYRKSNPQSLIFIEVETISKYLAEIETHIRSNFEKSNPIYSYYQYLVLLNESFERNISQQKIVINGNVMTRNCTDPWDKLEISADGMVKICCNINFPLYHVSSQKEGISSSVSNPFKESLLKGNLSEHCKICHIRKLVPVKKLKRSINILQKVYRGVSIFTPLPVRSIRIDVTENCNLRCTYCYVSHPRYHGEDMNSAIFDQVMHQVKNSHPRSRIYINGHGETTFHPKWKEWAVEILKTRSRPSIISNMAKHFSDEEINILAQFREIQISLDSHDEKMMVQIRKAVKPNHVFSQVERIKQSAILQGIGSSPTFSFSVGVYYPSIETMPEFMMELAKLKVKNVTFWNLVKYDHNKSTKPISEFSESQTNFAREKMRTAIQILKKNGIKYSLAGDFLASDGKKLI
jgi:sulfatase maturation enzyme AslB (radical SAM superfamily)